jgi:hypothetical protein
MSTYSFVFQTISCRICGSQKIQCLIDNHILKNAVLSKRIGPKFKIRKRWVRKFIK